MVKKVKICDLRILELKKKHCYLNFYPIFKNLVLKCLAEHLHLKKMYKKYSELFKAPNGPKNYKNG